MRRTKKDAEETRKLLIATALEVFAEKGYSNARLEEIAAKAGVTRGAIYWHFKNKDNLILSLVSETADVLLGSVSEAVNTVGTPLERLMHAFRDIIERVTKNIRIRSIMKLEYYYYDKPELLKSVNEIFKNRAIQFEMAFRKIIHEGQNSGEIDPSLKSNEIIGFMACVIRGYIEELFDARAGRAMVNVNKNSILKIIEAGLRAQ